MDAAQPPAAAQIRRQSTGSPSKKKTNVLKHKTDKGVNISQVIKLSCSSFPSFDLMSLFNEIKLWVGLGAETQGELYLQLSGLRGECGFE